jgi:acyl-CoA thioesterase FadM
VHVFVDRATQRPAPVPEASREVLRTIAAIT